MKKIIAVALTTLFAFNVCAERMKPKTTFSTQSNEDVSKKLGLSDSDISTTKNAVDQKLKDPKLMRGFERFKKVDAFGDTIPDSSLFYRQVLTQNQRGAYDEIYKALMNGRDEVEPISRVSYKEMNLITEAIYYDNPEIFWWDGSVGYWYNKDETVTKVTFKYIFPKEQLAQYNANFSDMSMPILFYANTLDTDMDKAKYIHDYLCLSIDYDYDSYKAGKIGGKLQTAYSAIVEYKTVCAGYSRAFAYYMQQLGIPCVVLSGSGHAWNFVEMDGDFYQMDVTWDDSGSKLPQFFNLPHSQMQQVQSHQLNPLSARVVQSHPTQSDKMTYKKYFGNIPQGYPYTYQEFNNIDVDMIDPMNAKVITQ